MQHITRTRLLLLALAASSLGFTIVVQDSLRAQANAQVVRKMDDGDAGYSAGRFTNTQYAQGFGGDASYFRKDAAGDSSASWTFANVNPGTCEAFATWSPTAAFGNATYSVTGMANPPAQKQVSQKAAPATTTKDGYKWESLGTFTMAAKGSVTITVKTVGNDYAQADGTMIVCTETSSATALPACGDGVKQTTGPGPDGVANTGDDMEQCDDGNRIDDDACTNACTLPRCGDGVRHAALGEQCDDGNALNTDGCTNECKAAKCGDGYVNGTEQCDNGIVGGPSCGPTCRLTVCGDRKVEGLEYCDDGNTVNGDGCSAQCVTEAPAGADTQTLAGINLSCEGLVPYATVRYAKNHANCVSLKKADGTFANAIQFFCDGTSLSSPITKKVDMRQGLALSAGDKVRLCHPMILQPWGCTADVTVTGTGCSEAPVCGNGVLQTGEECDDGNQSNADACLTTCKLATCGDGHVRAGYEGCDDGNRDDTDLCSYTCVPQRCGDGITQGNRGENCDDANQNNGDACTNACKTAVCGDGHVRIGVEFCDDGNTVNGDGCSSTCRTETVHVCGDGVKTGTEQCDDGNTVNGDGCSSTCQVQAVIPAGCGDGVRAGGEVCDDGANNGPSPLRCSAICRWNAINVCGNGTTEGIEQCDDGNMSDNDSCTKDCRTGRVCGNAVLDPGEECDDGNTVNGDGCSSTCQVQAVTGTTGTQPGTCGDWRFDAGEQCEGFGGVRTPLPNGAGLCCTASCRIEPCGTGSSAACGNGVREGSEQCDDGNRIDTDACRNNCTTNATTPANAILTLRTQDMGHAPHGLVTRGSVPVMRFTASAGTQNVSINGLRFTALEGNIQHGIFAVLKEKQPNDAPDVFYPGRHWYVTAPSQLGQAAFVFSAPLSIPANTTKTFEVELYMQCCNDNAPYTFTPVENTNVGPVRIDFDTASPSYVIATATVNGVATPLANIATNGACAADNCAIAVTTGPTRTVDVRHAGNLQISGEAAASSTQIAAGTESPVLLRLKMRMSNHENGQLGILPFSVQGGEAVESLSITVNGRTVSPATPQECGYLAPYSSYEQSMQNGTPQRLGIGAWYQWFGFTASNVPTNQFCTFFESSRGWEFLPRDADAKIEVRAKVKPLSPQWARGTKIKVSLIQNEHYLYALGETSATPLRPRNSVTTGGNITYSGVLSSNEHTVQ